MDKRKKLTPDQIDEIKVLIANGVKHETIARKFNVSATHISRIKAAVRTGSVNLKPTSLFRCLGAIETGLAFRRNAWPANIYYYYDVEELWFIQVNTETGCELITYDTIDLTLKDLAAKDWIVLTLESME